MFYKFFLAFSVVAVGSLFVESQKICPLYANNNSLVPCAIVNGTCYCVASQIPADGLFVTWDEANAFCRSANMNLVSIESEEKDREVNNVINNLWSPFEGYYCYWTSGRYNYNTARFEWTTTGEPLTYIPPVCCNAPLQPCNCQSGLEHLVDENECVANHCYRGYFIWIGDKANSVKPFTCEDRNY